MKSSLFAFPLVVFASVILGAACTTSTTGGTGGPTGGDVLTCQADGDPCDVDDDCCNFACAGGTCASTQTCTEDNDPCSADSECCSQVCASDGNCGFPSGVDPVSC